MDRAFPKTGELWQSRNGGCLLYVVGLIPEGERFAGHFRCLVIEHTDYYFGDVDAWPLSHGDHFRRVE